MEKGDGEKKPPGRSRSASDGIAVASSSSSPYASVNDDAMQLEESVPASSQPPLPTSRSYAVDSGVGIASHFHQTHHGNTPPYYLFPPGVGAAQAQAGGQAGSPPHASKRTRRGPSPSESLLLGGNPSQQQEYLANTLLYMSHGGATSSTILPLPSFAPPSTTHQQEQSNYALSTSVNAETPAARDQVLLPRPQSLRSGPVPDSPAQGLHTKQTTIDPNDGLINGYVPQALDSSAPLMVPPIGYQLPSRDDQKQGEIFIPHNNDVIVGGRGHESSVHPGNEKYRRLIASVRVAYGNSCKRDKPHVSSGIVRAVRAQNPPGRFLQRKDTKGLWFDVGDVKARDKTSHALREVISEESKTSGGSKILYGKFYHHQAKKSKNNKEGMDEESSAGDMEQHEHAGKQRITSLTTNKNVATASRPPLGSSVPGASAAGSSSEPTVGRSAEEQAHATTSSRDETRNKTASPSAATKTSEGHNPASSDVATNTSNSSERRKRGRPAGSKTKKRHRRFIIDGITASIPLLPTVLPPTQSFVPPISLPAFPPSTTAPEAQLMNDASSADRRMVEVRHSSLVASEERTNARNFLGNRTEPLKHFLPPPPTSHDADLRPTLPPPPPAVTPKPSDSSDLERRLSFADHLTNSSCSGNLSEHLKQQRASTDRYLMAGLLGLDPSEVTQALGAGKTEEEVIGEHLKDAGDNRKHASPDTAGKQKRRVVDAERLYAEMSFADPKKPLDRRISTALFSIGFVNLPSRISFK